MISSDDCFNRVYVTHKTIRANDISTTDTTDQTKKSVKTKFKNYFLRIHGTSMCP